MQTSAITAFDKASELLEREREQVMLNDWFDAVRQESRGRLALVGSEAGGGKTALLRRLCDERRGSVRILWGACDALFTPRPLGPLLDIAQLTAGELQSVVQSGAMPYDVTDALMRELNEHAPTVIVIEDVHWADEATLDVLRLLGRRIESIPALVLVSYRDDELEHAHPLRLVLGELATGRAIGRLKLAPLSEAAVARMAEPYAVDAAELYRRTAGNPFFVTEVLAAGEAAIPATVRDAVLARVARLDSAPRSLLEAVAVVPPQAELWLVEILAPDAVFQSFCRGVPPKATTASSSASRRGCCVPSSRASHSATSLRASPWNNRCLPIGSSPCIARRWSRSPIR